MNGVTYPESLALMASAADNAQIIGLRRFLDRRDAQQQAIETARQECTRELQSALLEDPTRTVYTPANSLEPIKAYTPAARVFFDALSYDREYELLRILSAGMKGEDIKTELELFVSIIAAEHGASQCVEAAE